MLRLLLRLLLLVLLLVAMMLIPPTPSHLLVSFLCLFLLQLLMNNMRAFLTTRFPCLQGNFGHCTSFGRRVEETPKTQEDASSATMSPTSSPTAPRGRSMTTPTRMATPTRTTTTTRMTTRRRIALGRRRRTSRRSCHEHVQP
jgi:hypothetical protein